MCLRSGHKLLASDAPWFWPFASLPWHLSELKAKTFCSSKELSTTAFCKRALRKAQKGSELETKALGVLHQRRVRCFTKTARLETAFEHGQFLGQRPSSFGH